VNEIAAFILGQLRGVACPWVALIEEVADDRIELGSAGVRAGAAIERVRVALGARTLYVELGFAPDAPEDQRRDLRELAYSLVSGFAGLQAMRASESAEEGHVLIVDDDAATRKFVRQVLERDGFAVLEAENGLIAHARALEFRPDLIIIDGVMPVLDGNAAARRLKADPFTAAIPLVMLTARARPDDRVAALEAGVQDFLTKPVMPAKLTRIVRHQLRWRRLLADEASLVVAAATRPASATIPLELVTLAEAAENAEERSGFADAADAYTRAADLAASLALAELANKFRRLAGKMYLVLAESAPDPEAHQQRYTQAAQSFLRAGNLALPHPAGPVASASQPRP